MKPDNKKKNEKHTKSKTNNQNIEKQFHEAAIQVSCAR